MQAAYLIGGGNFQVRKYKTAASIISGVVMLRAAANATGLSTSTTTSIANCVGLSMDRELYQGATIAYSTVQGDPEPIQSVIINPDLVVRALMVGSAANAVLTNNPIVTASSNGLTAVGTNTCSNQDEGTIWYTSGPNVGQSRKITSVSTATVTVIIPFAGNTVGDIFLAIATHPALLGATLSTDLTNVLHNNTALGSDAEFMTVELELNGNSNSYQQMLLRDHVFGGPTT